MSLITDLFGEAKTKLGAEAKKLISGGITVGVTGGATVGDNPLPPPAPVSPLAIFGIVLTLIVLFTQKRR